MADGLIFVSSSQSPDHRQLAEATAELIGQTPGFVPFFAPRVHEAAPPTDEIFRAIQDCVGMVAFLHARGEVRQPDREPFFRSSVWVNQELALVVFRSFDGGYRIPLLAFEELDTHWEGVLAHIMINPTPLGTREQVLATVSDWLRREDFTAAASGGEEMFLMKWSHLTAPTKLVLRALLDEGGTNVRDEPLRLTLRDRYIRDKSESSRALLQAISVFEQTGLVTVTSADPGHRQLTVHHAWRGRIVRQLATEGIVHIRTV
jgi:hypothetical protein